MAVLKTISSTHITITIFNIPIHILKYALIFTMGYSVAVLKLHPILTLVGYYRRIPGEFLGIPLVFVFDDGNER